MRNAHNRIILLAAVCVLLSACSGISLPGNPETTEPPSPVPPDWVEVFFTSPTSPDSLYYEGGPDEQLEAAIDAARLSVDIAAYSFNLWSLEDALLAAQLRGVTVRMVMDSDNMDVSEVWHLVDSGIPVVGDRRESLMHNKFVIIDRAEVWTGSLNYTAGGTYNDNNNLLRIRSEQVAQDYTTEFEEMFVEDHFGSDLVANTPHPRLSVNGTLMEVYFSPDDHPAGRIVELLELAQSSIHFLAYSFTSDEIAAAVIQAASDGVTISGVVDEGQAVSNEGAEYQNFRDNGLNVRLDGSDGLQHNKVIIIDEEIVITGSYNFTNNAETRNDENLVIIYDRDLAAQYLVEFQRIYRMAVP